MKNCWRLEANRQLDPRRKVELGQFLTPMPVAQLMASMLECQESAISLLDPCAGVGSLFAACIAELCQRPQRPGNIHVTAYELDPTLAAYLPETLHLCQQLCESAGIVLTGEIRQADFLESAGDIITASLLALTPLQSINAIILNPPYRKLQTRSRQWTLLQQAGMKTTNLYTGFLALCMKLLATNGEMIAITPRSFCSGSYFKPFREALLHTMTLRHLHLFESREHAFQEDDVLQETLILSTVKTPCTPETSTILITNTVGSTNDVVAMHTVPYHEVISPHDPQSCIRIVSNEGDQQIAKRMATLPATLEDLGIEVSTGRVVDFRIEALLRLQPKREQFHCCTRRIFLLVKSSGRHKKYENLVRSSSPTRAVISSFPMNLMYRPTYSPMRQYYRHHCPPLNARDVLPDNLAEAWKGNTETTALDIAEALSAIKGQVLPWVIVRDALSASLNARFVERASGQWPCDYAGARLVRVCQRRESVSPQPKLTTSAPLVHQPGPSYAPNLLATQAVLGNEQIQELYEQLTDLTRMCFETVGSTPTFQVRIELQPRSSATQQDLEKINQLLQQVSEELKFQEHPRQT